MPDRPNILVCMCDELRAFEVGCYGNEVIRTPNLDRLAGEGVRFDTAVSNAPVCMPGRSCTLSGQFTRTCTGELTNVWDASIGRMPAWPVRERVHLKNRTLPEQLRAAGYDTALIGKWHIHPAPETVGFDYALYPCVHHRNTRQEFVEGNGRPFVVDGFAPEYEIGQVEQYLRRRAQADRPFFLFYNISPPHMPLDDAPCEYRNLYHPSEIPLRPNTIMNGRLTYDEGSFKTYLWDFRHYFLHEPFTNHLPEGMDLRRLTALYYGLTTWTDDLVGRLMAMLDANGLARDTLVVFTSDHGDNLGSHGLFGKSTLYEESIRVPLIFRQSGRLAPQANTAQVAQLIDIMPTLLDVCGLETPGGVQGRSLAPILRGQRSELAENFAFIETHFLQAGLRTPTHMRGFRLADDRRTVADERECFYDLRSDPYQMRNLAATGEQADLAERLAESLRRWNAATPWMS